MVDTGTAKCALACQFMSPLPVTPSPSQQAAERANAAARLNIAVNAVPAPDWLASSANTLETLRVTMRQVIAGSSWPEPDATMRDCAIAASKLHDTAQLLTAALREVNTYAQANGVSAVDMRTAGWRGQLLPAVPPLPKTNTLRDISHFVQNCLAPLDATSFFAATEQLKRAQVALINGASAPAPGAPRGQGAGGTARPTRDGGLGHSAHLNNACGLLNKAREPLSLAAERIADSKRLLELYLKGTVGTATTSLPKTEKNHRKDRKETKEATKDAKAVAKDIAEANEEAKKYSRKLKDPEPLAEDEDQLPPRDDERQDQRDRQR